METEDGRLRTDPPSSDYGAASLVSYHGFRWNKSAGQSTLGRMKPILVFALAMSMPPMGDIFNPQELADIQAFVQSLK